MILDIRENIPLSEYTTLKVGGQARYLVEVESEGEVMEALKFAKQISAPLLLLGGGSNVLVSDTGFAGLVIINKLKGCNYDINGDKVHLTCGGGEVLDEVIAKTTERGYWGLENLSAIPGTVGATPVQNVGAYGVEVSSLIEKVIAVNVDTLDSKEFNNEECQFGYRDSFFKAEAGKRWFITKVTFSLNLKQRPILHYGALKELAADGDLSPETVRQKVIAIRSGKFPDWHKIGTAGSFFKNPIVSQTKFSALQKKYPDLPAYPAGENKVKISLGWVLDKVCGLRGYCKDGVCLYEKQALVLVNQSAKRASDIDRFADYIAARVKDKTGLELEREVRSV